MGKKWVVLGFVGCFGVAFSMSGIGAGGLYAGEGKKFALDGAVFDLNASTSVTCTASSVSVSPTKLTLKRKKSGDVTVSVTGKDACPVEGEKVTATVSASGKKLIAVSPTSAETDDEGNATFTVKAKTSTGNAKVTFGSGKLKKSMTIKVKK